MVIGTGTFVMQNSDAHKVFADVLNKVLLGHVTIIIQRMEKILRFNLKVKIIM